MYLVSRFFSSSDVAFISYISLNFVFGLCTMLVTLLPRLLAIISKVQVGIKTLLSITHKRDVCSHMHVCVCVCIDIYVYVCTYSQTIFFLAEKLTCFKHSWFFCPSVLLVIILNFNFFIAKNNKKKMCCNNGILIETLTFSRPLSCNWHIMGAVLVHWIDYMHRKICLNNTDIRDKQHIPRICNALYEQ